MILYFTNPITVIICMAIFKTKISGAVFVKPYSRTDELDKEFITLSFKLQEVSQAIAKLFEINFSVISQNDFLFATPDIIETTLIRNRNNHKARVIFQASDVYCVFGFSNYLKFLPTKVKLIFLFRKAVDYKSSNQFYIFRKKNYKIKRRNTEHINIEEVKRLLVFAENNLVTYSLKNHHIITSEKVILVLPPVLKNNRSEFLLPFLSIVVQLARKNNYKILVKPHKNDNTDYSKLIDKKLLINPANIDLKFTPVEFFLSNKDIEHVIAVPGSALVFADKSKTTVFVPKENLLFRKSYLDQIPFLKSIGFDFIRI